MNNTGKLGTSLPVQNVQALACKRLKQIPDRYMRPKLQSDIVSVDELKEIPVIDLRRLLNRPYAPEELVNLHSACEDWGFFQLINHGVSEEIIEKMKIDIQEFFKLPLEEKKAYSQLPNSIEGYGQAFVISEEQKLDWADMLYFVSLPTQDRNLRFWPSTPTSFRETLDKYSLAVERVATCLVELMAKNLRVEPSTLANMFENGGQGVRMNYYPPCPKADEVLGISPHSDIGALTLLSQVNEVEGLQIRKNGNWVPVKPISGALIVNIGDQFEIISNGKYKSIEHRVVINPEKERLSIAAFHSPNSNTMIGPLPDLLKEDAAHYKTTSKEDYVRRSFSTKLDGKKRLDLFRLLH